MSTIQLTDALLEDIRSTLQKHDSRNEDFGVAAQYLAAILGFLSANFPGEITQKRDILQQLFQFADHVLEQNCAPEQTTTPEAFGIWDPANPD